MTGLSGGIPHCPNCGHEIARQSTGQILQQVVSLRNEERVMILAPVVHGRKRLAVGRSGATPEKSLA